MYVRFWAPDPIGMLGNSKFPNFAKLSLNFSFSWAEMDFILNFPHPPTQDSSDSAKIYQTKHHMTQYNCQLMFPMNFSYIIASQWWIFIKWWILITISKDYRVLNMIKITKFFITLITIQSYEFHRWDNFHQIDKFYQSSKYWDFIISQNDAFSSHWLIFMIFYHRVYFHHSE